MKPNLGVNVGGVELRNPVLLASGTCGYGLELKGHLDFKKIGGLVAKSVTWQPRTGNPMPRVAECTGGMLNAIGLANVGVDVFCREKLPAMRKLGCTLIANVAGKSQEEYLQVAEALGQQPGLAALELNVSCPNVSAGGIEFGRDAKTLGELVAAVRKKIKLPLWVKLSPNVTDIIPLARAAEANGADALTVMNTLIGMRMDIRKRRPVLANLTGGLSGPAVKPVALHLVYRTSAAVKIPVIGAGGIETAEDALEFILAGARAVEIGTATFRNPHVAEEIAQGLADFLAKEKINSFRDIEGAGRL
jgi:dihydroorotate dehydrogenase (NAD+) catalytic subunit